MTPAEKRSVIDNAPFPVPTDQDGRAKSYQITLPKHWCREHGWPKNVAVSRQADGSLRVEAVRE